MKSTRLYRRLYNLFEHPAIFNLNQVILDGGKMEPMRRFLSRIPFESVLDIGCGTGNWVDLVPGQYVGIDRSKPFVEAARRRHRNRENASFRLGDVTQWNSDERFDLVFLISVLHHLSDEEVGNLLRWTAENARWLFVMDLFPNPGNPISRVLYALDRGDYIRTPAAQQALVLDTGRYTLFESDAFYSTSRLYRHTLFLFESGRHWTRKDEARLAKK